MEREKDRKKEKERQRGRQIVSLVTMSEQEYYLVRKVLSRKNNMKVMKSERNEEAKRELTC